MFSEICEDLHNFNDESFVSRLVTNLTDRMSDHCEAGDTTLLVRMQL